MKTQDIPAPQTTEMLPTDPVSQDNAESRPSLAQNAQVKHLISDGVYVKAYHVAPGIKLVNKQFPTDHITILAKGSVIMEGEGTRVKFVAPAHFNFQADTRYVIGTLEECVWYCIHPTDETDLETLVEKF
jgi:hypothetical protein